ncbi:MAG: hypothetical protein EPN36_16500 [Rhodanobacteraceae bacterium]|nr:MAG: hypothetical protein EPN36_16500 [Rhodanobacteraceae bacterium]
MKQYKANRLAFWSIVALVGLGGAVSAPTAAIAGPADVIYSPIVDYREWELELKGGMFNWGHGDEGERAAKLSLGYGIAPRWKTELVAEYAQTPGSAARVEEYEFENIFQLTEHGAHWLDAGIFAEFAHNRLEHTNSLVIGPMFQKEIDRTQFNLNLFFARRLSALPEGEADSARNEVKYQAQWKYNLRSTFQPGMQVFGSLGDPAHLRSDKLSVGPAFFGVARLGNAKKLRYNAAILAGLTHGTPDTTVRFQLEYEFF